MKFIIHTLNIFIIIKYSPFIIYTSTTIFFLSYYRVEPGFIRVILATRTGTLRCDRRRCWCWSAWAHRNPTGTYRPFRWVGRQGDRCVVYMGCIYIYIYMQQEYLSVVMGGDICILYSICMYLVQYFHFYMILYPLLNTPTTLLLPVLLILILIQPLQITDTTTTTTIGEPLWLCWWTQT